MAKQQPKKVKKILICGHGSVGVVHKDIQEMLHKEGYKVVETKFGSTRGPHTDLIKRPQLTKEDLITLSPILKQSFLNSPKNKARFNKKKKF